MKLDWNIFIGKTVNVTMNENYGMVYDERSDSPLYEIVFKTGKLNSIYDDGILLDTIREGQTVKIFIPYPSIKCVEVFDAKE